jgi:hypothetical protein
VLIDGNGGTANANGGKVKGGNADASAGKATGGNAKVRNSVEVKQTTVQIIVRKPSKPEKKYGRNRD